MITIDKETERDIRSPLELDNMANRYKTTNSLYTFTSPELWTIEKNLFYLLKNSTKKSFEPKYKMKPDYLSYDEYGTTALSQLLMYVNGVFCIEDFDLDEVVIPQMSAIVDVCQDKFPKKDVDELEEVEW